MATVCRADGCEVLAVAKGLCKRHWHKERRYGDPAGGAAWLRGESLAWLIKHAAHVGEECLTWPFARSSSGYPIIQIDGRQRPAHREMCCHAHGEPPREDFEAAHSCGKGHLGCINPKHLRWATSAENQKDRIEHGTSSRGSGNGCAKLTEEAVRTIKLRLQSGTTQADLAREHGVTISTIHLIKTGRNWGWIKEAA